MQREIIERLAMDRTLGELTEDAAALFETYLGEHPEIQEWAGQMAQTCELTRETINKKTQVLETENTATAARSPWIVRMHWAALGRWAAVILIALSIGGGLGRWSKPKVVIPGHVVAAPGPAAEQKGWSRVLSQPEGSFWRTKAVAMLEPKSYNIPSAGSARGGLWDRYRQFTKEQRYE